MQNSAETDRAQPAAPKDRAPDDMTAAEHEKAAMLAEFNGTYDLARFHRERAARLRTG
jgi:hypothetical protein